MTHLLSDIRYAIRSLRKAPLFTIVATTSIALGIGANTAIFTMLDRIVLRPLPIERPHELVQIRFDGAFIGNSWGDNSELSFPMFEEFRDHNTVFSGMFARFGWLMHVNTGQGTERVTGELVTGAYFDVLGVRPALGRLITPDDDRHVGSHPVAVLNYGLWKNQFAAERDVVGRKITINGRPFTIIGVTEERFKGIEASADLGIVTEVYVPMMMKPQLTPGWNYLDDRRARFARVFGRLRPGVTAEQAEAALQPFFRQIRERELKDAFFARVSASTKRAFREASIQVVSVPQGASGLRRSLNEPLWTLMAIVVGVLLIACANVAGLLLARGVSRQREIAIRQAVGGSRARLVQQLLVESLVIAAAGAAAGAFLATWGTSVLMAMLGSLSPEVTVSESAAPDARVLVFTIGLALVTGLLFGTVPALQTSNPAVAPTLKDQAGTVIAGGPVRLRKALVTAQVALSLLLLTGAGLFVRSLQNLLAQDPGIDTADLVAFTVDPSLNAYEPQRNRQFSADLIRRIRSLPGVVKASAAGIPILQGDSWNSSMTVEGYDPSEGQAPVAFNNTVMPGYFDTLGIPLLLGRDFTDGDVRTAPPVEGERGIAIANQLFVDRYFGGRNPLGRHVGFGSEPGTKTPIEIVGVVGTAKYRGIRDEAEPQLFFPLLQDASPRFLAVFVRTSGAPSSVFPQLRAAVRELDADLPVYDMRTMEMQVQRSLANERLVAGLSSALGVLATLLAVVGLYGVMAYTVTRRRREVGIRMALGAQAVRVAWLFLREASYVVLVGFGVGLPAVWAAGRYIQSQLYGVEPLDPGTIAAAMVGLAAVATAGALVPALRAARINPLAALREE
jgi:predicted permease